MSRCRAFTSVEMIIVLGLVAILCVTVAPSLQPSRQAITEQQFWHAMRQQWRRAQVAAQLDHQSTIISCHSDTQQVEFWRDGDASFLNIPATLRPKRFVTVFIHEDGYAAPQTICFDSTLNHRRYLMKVQLAWGGYRLEKTHY